MDNQLETFKHAVADELSAIAKTRPVFCSFWDVVKEHIGDCYKTMSAKDFTSMCLSIADARDA